MIVKLNYTLLALMLTVPGFCSGVLAQADSTAMGDPGLTAKYSLSQVDAPVGTVVATVSLALGHVEVLNGIPHQWLQLDATKVDGTRLSVWLLSDGFPASDIEQARATSARYIFQAGDSSPLEYRDKFSGRAVLPSSGGWSYLIPRSPGAEAGTDIFPEHVDYLGHRYVRDAIAMGDVLALPPNIRVVPLLPDVLVGIPINTREKDETRRYDDSDYDYIPLTRSDFSEMMDAGINCFSATPDHRAWFEESGAIYHGVGGADVSFPECLYKSQYLGPAMWLNEPAVVTRDHVLRPRLREDEAFRKAISPQAALAAFEEHYAGVVGNGPPTRFIKGLAARADVDLGTMDFSQQSIHSWETMVSSAAYQLSQATAPASIVFEPPGHVGTRRTLPEMNMTYGCQIPVDGANNLIDIIIGFTRGAARLTDKSWGISIYGSVTAADSPWFMTHAYDMGATRFFFWNNSRLACVPHGEILALTRNLQAHARKNPHRDLERLREAAEVAILLPPGYNLGHVYMGKGILWGIGELNLERRNREGVQYRTVMGNFFTEIERCLRLGVAFDLMWDLPGIKPEGYREVVRVREDGKVEIMQGATRVLLDEARTPTRPEGKAPQLTVQLSVSADTAPLDVTAYARIIEGSAPVYYTHGPDSDGIAHNTMVAWELYGPNEEDYRYLRAAGPVRKHDDGGHAVDTAIHLDQPGNYRLRIATVDLAGRTSVLWKEIEVRE